MTGSWHMAVLIPARNEEVLLGRCLRSVLQAAIALPPAITFDIVVVADSSTDRTALIAERILHTHGAVTRICDGMVGRARAAAAEIALARYFAQPARDANRCWLANTDADCCVPRHWLAEQLAMAAEQNMEAVAGTVDVDSFADHDACVEQRFRATYPIAADGSHPHVHGANLGVRADAYLRAGGWGDLASAEDHDLWTRLRLTGARRLSTNRTRVLTSGRRTGRAPSGFAQALAAHNEAAL
jgi:glycosyltransferase involved in cell wall biosynthesis